MVEFVISYKRKESEKVYTNTHIYMYVCVCIYIYIYSVQFNLSVVSDSLWPRGLQHARPLVRHQLLEPAQTHVHWVGDVMQPSHPLWSPSPPAFNHSQYQSFPVSQFFTAGGPKYWSFSFSISPSNEYSLGWTGLIFLQSKGLSRVFSNTIVKKHNI